MQKHRTRVVCSAMLAVALAALGLAGSAQAKLTGELHQIRPVPLHQHRSAKVHLLADRIRRSGARIKIVPIEKPVVLQGAYRRRSTKNGNREILRRHQRHHALQSPPERPRRAARHRARSLLAGPGQSADQILPRKQPDRRQLDPRTGQARLGNPGLSENNLAGEVSVGADTAGQGPPGKPLPGQKLLRGLLQLADHLETDQRQTSPPAPNKPITGIGGEVEFLEKAASSSSKTTKSSTTPGRRRRPTAAEGSSPSSSPRSSTRSSAPLPRGTTRRSSTDTSTVARGDAVKKNNEENP